MTRPESIEKPVLSAFKNRGAVIKAIASPYSDDGSLQDIIDGADVVISAINYLELQNQRPVIDAIARSPKKSRFIPCDFGTACPHGIRAMHDEVRNIA